MWVHDCPQTQSHLSAACALSQFSVSRRCARALQALHSSCKASRLQLVPHVRAHRKVGDAAGHVDGAGQRGGLGEAQAGREQEDQELRAART